MMDAASGPLVDSINGGVKLIGGGGGNNLNNLSMIQDGIISSTNHHNHIHHLNQLHHHQLLHDNHHHSNLGVAAELGLIKVGGVSPLLPESNDLIYTDLSNNVTLKQDHHHQNQHNHLQPHPQVGGGGYSSTAGGLWSNNGGGGGDADAFGGGMGMGGGALDFSDLVNISNCSSIGGGVGGAMSMPVTDGFDNGGNGGIEDLDNVSCPTPSLSDNDNFSFLSDCSESGGGGGGGGGEGKGLGGHNHGSRRENDYVQAWVSSEPPNPFPLPSLSTVSALRQLEQPSSGEVPQVPWLDGVGEGVEGGPFTTINTADLDSLLGPNSVTASVSGSATGATSSSLTCGDCSKTFDNPMTLQIHMRLHTGERPYKCAKCGEAFIHYTYLDYHMKNSHGGKSPSKASAGQRKDSPEKKKSVNANGLLLLGPPATANTKAGLGNSRTKSKTKKKNGLVENASTDPAPNGAGGPYPCPYCQRGFRHSSWLIAHMRTHTGEKPFKCTHCELAYTQRGNLMSHLKRQHNIIDDGTICPSTPGTPAAITNVPSKPEAQPSFASTSTNLTLRRIKTKKKKPSSSTMPRLVDQTIGSESHSHDTLPTLVNQSNGGRPVKCTICGASFSQRQALSVHMRSHGEASFPCSECGRKFRQPGNLRKHVRDMHGGNSEQPGAGMKGQPVLTHPPEAIPYIDKYDIRPCTVKVERCDPATSGETTTKRKKPIKSVFSKKKLGGLKQGRNFKKPMAFPPSGPGYQCTVCDKVLLTTTNLTVHMRIHTGEKPYQCSFCKKTFSVQSNLKAHERLHTGEKPYQCTLCSTAFTTRGNFTAHLRSHGVNPYKCSMCTEQFTFSWKLKKHMFVAHNKKMKAEHKQIAS